jgi:hypothetical protein
MRKRPLALVAEHGETKVPRPAAQGHSREVDPTGGAHILGVEIVWTIAAPPCCALLGIAARDGATKLA